MIDLPISARWRDGFFVVKRYHYENARLYEFVVAMAGRQISSRAVSVHHIEESASSRITATMIADQATRWIASNIVWC